MGSDGTQFCLILGVVQSEAQGGNEAHDGMGGGARARGAHRLHVARVRLAKADHVAVVAIVTQHVPRLREAAPSGSTEHTSHNCGGCDSQIHRHVQVYAAAWDPLPRIMCNACCFRWSGRRMQYQHQQVL
jgi:hypothetical protein